MACRPSRQKFINGVLNPNYRPCKSGPSGKSGKKYGEFKNRFDAGNFLAFDSEGVNTGKKILGDSDEHKTILWACSDKTYLHNSSGISSVEALTFILNAGESNPGAIPVIFAGTYDVNMLLKDWPRDKIEQIWLADGGHKVWHENFGVAYIPRKYLDITERWATTPYILKNGKWKSNIQRSIRIYDVFGFFQCAFTGAVEMLLGKDYDDLAMIREGKQRRNNFANENLDYILSYTQAELRALVLLMKKLRDGLADVGLSINAWHGAGAIASAMLKKHDVKKHYADLPEPVLLAARHAYFGGRIELVKFGYTNETVYHYDINSAYPAEQRNLPVLTGGRWYYHDDLSDIESMNPLTVFHVKFKHKNTVMTPLYPFPYRSDWEKKVLFPSEGEGWYWKPEVEVAIATAHQTGGKYEILEAWEFVPLDNSIKPFGFIEEYYKARQELLKKKGSAEYVEGAQLAYKLGLNSLYGKCAQNVGGKGGKPPAYANLAYAGYITSATRAKLFMAAMKDYDSTIRDGFKQSPIIALATDGIFSTEKLDLDCKHEKELGAWHEEKHDGIVMVQSGFYFLLDKGKWSAWSRGFDKIPKDKNYHKNVSAQIDMIIQGWKKKLTEVYLPCTRFVTMGSALVSAQWWKRWCCWYAMQSPTGEPGRRLGLDPGHNTKRSTSSKTLKAAASGLVETWPTHNHSTHMISAPYDPGWLNDIDLDEDERAAVDCEAGQE